MKTLIRSRGFLSSGLSLLCSIFLVGSANVKAVDFTEIARFNISATGNPAVPPGDPLPPPDSDFVGVSAVALAYNGTKLYVAGYNNSASFGETSIVEITNPTAKGLVTPTFSNKFSTDASTPGGRGFSGLALSPDGTKLAAAFDDGIADTPLGLQAFDTSNNTQLWAKANRGGSGVAFDPGFPGGNAALGSGVAYVQSFGSGRRSLQNATTGADIWTPTDGMIWIPNAGVTDNFTRDIAFNPATGDMYIRSKNELYFADRSGDNLTDQANNVLLVDNADAPFVNNQHLAFMNTSSDGDLIILNDRSSGAVGQDFFAVNKVYNTAGISQTANFSFLPNADSSPFVVGTGAGWYDYDFDATTQTLALLDTSNSFVHIFQVGNASAQPGDFDNDGDVDGHDFLVWQRGGSPNGINSGDLGTWQSNYGRDSAGSYFSCTRADNRVVGTFWSYFLLDTPPTLTSSGLRWCCRLG